MKRRTFLKGLAATTIAGRVLPAANEGGEERPDLHVAPFRFDVTPPEGHPLCGGWIKPVVGCDDPLEALGFVLLGAGKPIVICAVDWTGILNEAHVAWREALAEAAGTTPDRVAVQAVHQHNAPFACLGAQRIVATQADLPPIIDIAFFRQCLDRARAACAAALPRTRRVTHIAHGTGPVREVASNRRTIGSDGKVLHWRGSSTANPLHHALPEGLIDPVLRTVAFYHGDEKLVACHYYATHPMSYYGDGRVSSDFAGLARKRRQQDEPGCLHVYFTGCAGNIAAGKYNDGSKEARRRLTDRLYAGIARSEAALVRRDVGTVTWRTREITPPPRAEYSEELLKQRVADGQRGAAQRGRPAYRLAWLRRSRRGTPIVLSSLDLGPVALLHLPAECFVEYQLRAQELGGQRFVATAAYGDGGPWYIPTRDAYPQGGYEVSVAFCDPAVDPVLTAGIANLLA